MRQRPPPIATLFPIERAAAASDTRGALDAAQQMKAEQRVGVALLGMAQRGVPAPAAIEILAPRNRMVGAHFAAHVRRFVERRQDVDLAAWVRAKIVPLV